MAAKHVLQSGAAALVLSLVVSGPVRADEGGLSFWLPGLFGSFAAAPGQPGLSVATFYYHALADASGGKEFFRGDKIVAGVQGRGDLFGVGPSYTFATPVFGGQASVSLLGVGGRNFGVVDATLTGPRGNAISGERSQSAHFDR
jgi:hypothetical protein